ncbi:hypothetical protein DV736_g3617, partial [Chaetothyriales sp. CBS 134916]
MALDSPDASPRALQPSQTKDNQHPVGVHSLDHEATSSSQPYFASAYQDAHSGQSQSAAEVARGARSGAELLRRLSLAEPTTADSVVFDPLATYPALGLSGNIISAACCLPYQFGLRPNDGWEICPRRGTSALFDNFAYLASDKTPWKHTLVGWTGEIDPVQRPYSPQAPLLASDLSKAGLTADSASHPAQPVLPHSKPLSPPVSGIRAHLHSLPTDTVTVTAAQRQKLEEQLVSDRHGTLVPVWLPPTSDDPSGDYCLKDQGRWRRYAEHELYTLFHYRQHPPDDGRAEKRSWKDYQLMNQIFADKILQIYRPGDIIWIHDYHLMLLPNMLRQRIANAYIGFFLHIPFPSSEYLRCLSRRKDILGGSLGATMIGFQAYSFARHFNSCCKRILGFESDSAGVDAYGAHVAVDAFPIGVDVEAVKKAAFDDPAIEENMAALSSLYAGKKIIVGRDRLDTVRGVAQKLMAFELLLDRYPDWCDKVVLIQVTSPTSVQEETEDAGHKIEHRISSLVSRINGKFGSLSYTPVQHYPQYISSHEYFALLRIADVGLITSVRDGMNTTSLEYVICQRDNHGPLILSEFSGTAACLSSAIHINPWDLGGVASAINDALSMSPSERAVDHRRLYNYVTTHTVSNWSNNFLKRLLTNLASFSQSELTPLLDRTKLQRAYIAASKRLFMFDYDGTLTPIVKDPNAAIPTDKITRTLKFLAEDHRNSVWIISGRDAAFLEAHLGHISELGLSAEHGCFLRHPGSDLWENLAASMDMSWQAKVVNIFTHYTERTPGSWIERKRVALTWHYRQADPDFGLFQAQEAMKVLQDEVGKKWDVEVMSGKANVEVRPRFVNKGYIAKSLVEDASRGAEKPGFVLCLGDDRTDEDMFLALQETELPKEYIFTCTVGASSKKTLAHWHLLEPADVITTIASLVQQRDPKVVKTTP